MIVVAQNPFHCFPYVYIANRKDHGACISRVLYDVFYSLSIIGKCLSFSVSAIYILFFFSILLFIFNEKYDEEKNIMRHRFFCIIDIRDSSVLSCQGK